MPQITSCWQEVAAAGEEKYTLSLSNSLQMDNKPPWERRGAGNCQNTPTMLHNHQLIAATPDLVEA